MLRSARRSTRSLTLDRFTVARLTRGAWPRGSRNMRLSKITRGWRLAITTCRTASLFSASPSSPGMPARSVTCVATPRRSPAMQMASPSRLMAAPGWAGCRRTQSAATKSARRAGAVVKVMQAVGGSASGSVRTRRTCMPAARRASVSCFAYPASPGARSSTASRARIATSGRSMTRIASASTSSEGISPAPASADENARQAACAAWAVSGGVRRSWARARASQASLGGLPVPANASSTDATPAQSLRRCASVARCSIWRRFCGVNPAGLRARSADA